jgi:CubicO group peptidase (beta-lactamase class C family)
LFTITTSAGSGGLVSTASDDLRFQLMLLNGGELDGTRILGKVIGVPTMGAVIGTGSYTLLDGSAIRTPGSAPGCTDSCAETTIPWQ